MPRTSKRNILPALTGADIDAAGKGAQVSDEIQLVYVVDDIRVPLYAYAGIGEFTPAASGRSHFLQIECRNPRGLVIDEMVGVHHGGQPGDPDNLILKCNTQTFTEPDVLPAPVGQLEPLAFNEGIPALAEARSGTVPSGAFNGGRPGFTVSILGVGLPIGTSGGYGGPVGALQGLFVEFGKFLVMISGRPNAASQWSLRWHELG